MQEYVTRNTDTFHAVCWLRKHSVHYPPTLNIRLNNYLAALSEFFILDREQPPRFQGYFLGKTYFLTQASSEVIYLN